MIREACLYLAAPDDRSAARCSVAGRPVAFRVVMAAVRAGIGRVRVPAVFREPALETLIARTPSARAAVAWLDLGAAMPTDEVLLLPATMHVTAAALRPLTASDGVRCLAGLPDDRPVGVTPSDALEPLWESIVGARPVGVALTHALAKAGAARLAADPVVLPVTDAATAAEAEARLYRTLGSAIDSPLDRAFHRRLSHPLTRWAVAQQITPNTITVASIVCGLGAALAAGSDGVSGIFAALVLYVVAVVLDHSDGEVARVSFAESRLGEWLDIGGDTLVHSTLVLALGITSERLTGRGAGWGLIAAAGVLASAWAAKTSAPADRGVARFFDTLGTRDGFYGMLLGFATVLVAWPAMLPAFMVFVAVGTHAYWIGHALTRR